MMNNFDTAKINDVVEKETLEKMYAWSKGFQKFVCYPLSACFLEERTTKEIIRFYENTNKEKLAKAFILYPSDIRRKVLWCLDNEDQRAILQSMYQFAHANAFSLNECVEAEKSMQDTLETLWPGNFNEYKEMKEMEELIAHKIGKNMYPFSKDIHIRKEKQDIYLSVDVNVQEFHIHFEEPSWHSACYARSLEAYLFFLHGYIQKHGGTVHLDVVYEHKVPNMENLFTDIKKELSKKQERVDEEQYFLLIYRIRNLIRLYPWIKLSKMLERQVQEINSLIKKKNFLVKVTGKHLLDEMAFLERIKANFSDDIVNKNFMFWLFREDGKYRKTCIRLIDVADFWWIKDSSLTLVFFGMPAFEKSILKMLLFMGLGIDLFLDNSLKVIDVDRLKLGLGINGCDGIKIRNIQCMLYDISGIDTKYKEMFLMLNDNCYNDKICFRYLEGMKLSNENLLQLKEESVHSIDAETIKTLNHCYDIFLTLRIEGTPAIYEWHKKPQDMPYHSENLLAVNKLFQIGLTGIDDWDTSCKKVNQYINDRQMSVLEKNLLQIYFDFYNLLFWHFNNDTMLTEGEMIGFLLNFVPMSQRCEQSNQFYDVKSTFRERFDKLNWVTEEVERENEIYWNYYLNREGETDE